MHDRIGIWGDWRLGQCHGLLQAFQSSCGGGAGHNVLLWDFTAVILQKALYHNWDHCKWSPTMSVHARLISSNITYRCCHWGCVEQTYMGESYPKLFLNPATLLLLGNFREFSKLVIQSIWFIVTHYSVTAWGPLYVCIYWQTLQMALFLSCCSFFCCPRSIRADPAVLLWVWRIFVLTCFMAPLMHCSCKQSCVSLITEKKRGTQGEREWRVAVTECKQLNYAFYLIMMTLWFSSV